MNSDTPQPQTRLAQEFTPLTIASNLTHHRIPFSTMSTFAGVAPEILAQHFTMSIFQFPKERDW